MSLHETYPLLEYYKDDEIDFLFVSKGKARLTKTVQYRYLGILYGYPLYNLGFGEVNPDEKVVDDLVISNNGDVYKVFYSVLATVPEFFKRFPNALLSVEGSDSSSTFIEQCRMQCIRQCQAICKKFNRRLSIYHGYIERHFESLTHDFRFFGSIQIGMRKSIEAYQVGKRYDTLFIQKKR